MTEHSIFAAELKTTPYWWEAVAPDASPERPPAIPARADVAVIGAGFTGLSAALRLARAGRDVVVLDAEALGYGASTRNGGMIGSGHRHGFFGLAKSYGESVALELLGEGTKALEYTTELIAREAIDCAFARVGRFRAAWLAPHYDAIGREVDILRDRLGVDAYMVSKGEQHAHVASDAYHGGCVFPSHGGLHPARFHHGLLGAAREAGARVIGHTPVTGVRRDGRGVTLATPQGEIGARDAIVATNGYTGPVTGALRRRLVPLRSYIIATEELAPGTVERLFPALQMIVETRMLHCYYRPSPDGRRIVFGGRAAMHQIAPEISGARLHGIMVGLFPELSATKITHSWSGRLGFTRAELPHLGQRDGLYYALGYSGSGVAMAPYLGWRIAEAMLGTKDSDCAFARRDFKALPLYTGNAWFLPLVDRWYKLCERVGGE